ncbi:stress protein [Reichenbachiella sp. MSK19-1]|uniref:stress protein n=1 Tax=Reichenbachiella sp. MSK19-1 TaxID=1897631 RepID=UPI0011C4A366|nr:stress protein [Reichenbachiella sp. MSK19-1]
MKFAILFVLSMAICSMTLSQPKFDIQTVNKVETSFNTVTNTIHQTKQGHFLYSAGDGNQIDLFAINERGEMKAIESYEVSGGKKTVRGLISDTVHGKDLLFAGLKGGDAVEVFEIKANGRLQSLSVTKDTDTTYLGIVITLQVVHMKDNAYLFVGGLEKTPGLSSFKITPEGDLEHIQSMADTDSIFTDGIIGMSLHVIDGKTYLLTGGFQDNGLSSWRIFENGQFENISNIPDDNNLFLNGTYPVISTTIKGWNYVIVGHRHHSYYQPTPWVKDRHSYYYHGDAITVFWVNNQGQLVPRSAFIDNNETLIQGQTRLHRLPYNQNFDLIAAATRDDQSIQLCMINQNGRLSDAGKIETGFPIYYGLTGYKIEGQLFLFAGSVDGKTMVSYRLDKQ